MYLSELESGQMGHILSTDLLPQREKQRLASMGLINGAAIYVLRNNNKSSLVVEYKDTFLAISFDIAQSITVTKTLIEGGI